MHRPPSTQLKSVNNVGTPVTPTFSQYLVIFITGPKMENSTVIDENPNDVVVTGISGVYPGSKNIVELENHLRNKVNLISSNCYFYWNFLSR